MMVWAKNDWGSSRKTMVLFLFLMCCFCGKLSGVQHTVNTDFDDAVQKYRLKTKNMFYHAYYGYMKNAYPLDELRPLTCDGVNTWGNYSLTLVDALDTLAVIGDYKEFRRVADLVVQNLNPYLNVNVSVFETNIRVIGGLLSAHLLSQEAGMNLAVGWPCAGPLLDLAAKFADRILPAFNTKTGMPYGAINLLHGVNPGETPVSCTAAIGTFLLEFGTLSRLTGNPIYEEKAIAAIKAVNSVQSRIGLVGNHVNVQTGGWTATDAGIGAGVDSFFEYLVKGANLLNQPDTMEDFLRYRKSINKYLRRDDWYFWADMKSGAVTQPIFQSLEAFWPGLEVLIGEVDSAYKSLLNYFSVWHQYGMTPEFYNVPHQAAYKSREGYPLRPELLESIMYLYKATKDPHLMQMGMQILDSIEKNSKTECGYATVKDVRDHKKENRMESFFLAETVKYLYLLFDRDNFLHGSGRTSQSSMQDGNKCLLGSGGYIFNTEAHAIDPAALHCCAELSSDIEKSGIVLDAFDINPLFESSLRNFSESAISPSKRFLRCESPPNYFIMNLYGEVTKT